MKNNEKSKFADNGLFVIDKNFSLVYANKTISELYPNLKQGIPCYYALHGYNSKCPQCPIGTELESSSNIFNYKKNMWFYTQTSEIQVDGFGDCYCITTKPIIKNKNKDFINPDTKEIIEHNQALLENNELWNIALNNMPNGYHRCSTKEGYPFLFVSDRFCEIVGYSREEIVKLFDNKLLNMLHPDNKNNNNDIKDILGLKSNSKNYHDSIYRLNSKHGYIWVLETTKLVKSAKGNFYQGTITDISSIVNSQIKNKLNLSTAEARLIQYKKAIISGANVICEVNISKDILDNILIFKNGKEYPITAFYDIKLPCSYTWFLNNISQFIKDDERERFLASNNIEFLRSNFDKGIHEWQIEYDTTSTESNFKNLRKTFILSKNEATHETNALIVTKDISNKIRLIKHNEEVLQKQKENLSNALRDAEQRLQVINSLCSEYIIVIHVNFNDDLFTPYILPGYIDYIPKIAKLQNIPSIDKIKKYLKKMICEEDCENVLKHCDFNKINQELKKRNVYTINCHMKITGKREHGQIQIINTGKLGEQIWALRSTENIVKEERKQQNELKLALSKAQKGEKAKTSFLMNMSHDIRTPMNAVIGFTEIAINNIDNKEKTLNALLKSQKASKHLLNLINDILEMVRIDSGKTEICAKVANVQDAFDSMKDMFASDIAKKGIKFITSNQYSEPYVNFDITKVMQVITNLLGNALKFTQKGQTITFTSKEYPVPDSNYVNYEVHIKDTGIGMSKEFQKRLYDIFERERTSTVTGTTGTGLGLAISKKLAIALGGNLTCESELGVGTDFTFIFPARIANKYEISHSDNEKIDTSIFTGKRVLVVEDNELNMEIALEILQNYGFITDSATDGSEAVEKIKLSQPGDYDLVLMDIQMPVMDGYEATKKIRHLDNYKLANIPIVAMTANAFSQDKKQALEAGMNGHITKPIDFTSLARIIKEIL